MQAVRTAILEDQFGPTGHNWKTSLKASPVRDVWAKQLVIKENALRTYNVMTLTVKLGPKGLQHSQVTNWLGKI